MAGLSACSPRVATVSLDPGPGEARMEAAAMRPVVAVGPFADKRGQGPDYLGTIRGGFGEPLVRVRTEVPVRDAVRSAFTEGLAERGLLADGPAARYTLSGDIVALDCNQYIRREAEAILSLVLRETDTGKVLAVWPVQQKGRQDAAVAGTAEEAPAAGLRSIAEATLRHAVDAALDGPAFRNAIR